MRCLLKALGLIPCVVSVCFADHSENDNAPKHLEEVYVTGGAEAIKSLAGSATFLDQEAIQQFDVSDINRLLTQVPGVYIRQEDGYGLRPNIGLRGATSERSQKVTLMEDGILISPAPYAAPAAYYLPNISRMDALEVFKGPAAIHYGPHTVGGALNMVTRAIPTEKTGEVQLTAGTDNYQKYRAFYGDNGDLFGFYIDGLRYSADGFKSLAGRDTGFVRNDINGKIRWRSENSSDAKHTLEVKLGYADEDSNETYLGLTDADFYENPTRRYAASELDQFISEHTQIHGLYRFRFSDDLSLSAKAYINRFDRSWNKFNGFISGECEGDDIAPENADACPISPAFVLSEALGDDARELRILRGEIDSNGEAFESIDVTDNDREYGSSGIEVHVDYALSFGGLDHTLNAGVRFHNDYVERNHLIQAYRVIDASLVKDVEIDDRYRERNKSEVDAFALFVSDEIQWNDWKINVGVRFEDIQGKFYEDTTTDAAPIEQSQSVVIPGLGVFYQYSESIGLLAGINKGFSPSSPSTSSDAEPEESVNYEYGIRYEKGLTQLEAIGFYSDYKNLLGRCRASDPDCSIGEEFNGGEVETSGVELTAKTELGFSTNYNYPLSLVYTYTDAAFESSFESGFSQWGIVTSGDELPYMPEHQLRLQAGIEASQWGINAALRYTSEMREVPGRGAFVPSESIKGYALLDLSGQYYLDNGVTLQLVAENLADKQVIVSRRPFGARPNAPRSVKLGVKYQF